MAQSNRSLLNFVVPAVLAVAAGVLTGWAAYDLSPPHSGAEWSDLVYRTLRNLGPGEAFDSAGADGNLKLQATRWLGLIVVAWAVLGVVFLALRRTRIRLMVAMRRNHVVVVGHNHFADRLSAAVAARKAEVVQMQEGGDTSVDGERVCLPYAAGDPKALAAAGLARARKLIIAVDDDAQAAGVAMAAQATHPRLNVVTRMTDLWLARNLHTLPGGEKLRTFTEATAAAREVLRRHPPYLTARDLGQARIHSVLIGDHDWLEALMVETILSACTLTYGKPAFNFVCLAPERFRERLFARYPDLANAADIAIFTAQADSHAPLSVADRSQLNGQGPVTSVYCAMTDEAASLAAALAYRNEALKDDAFNPPVFVRASGQGMPRPVAGSRLGDGALVPFGSLDDIARATGILSVDGEQAEKTWHRAYLALNPGDKNAAKPWDDLPEEFRISNQRAVGHVYAKLFEAGFDLRPWLAAHDPWVELPSLARGETLWRSDAERTRLAELEHERWTADRRMSGWIGGPARDNVRKLHDNMVPFAQLTAEIQGYDYAFVDLVDKVLKRAKDGVKR